MATDFDTLAARLRAWAAGSSSNEAAVELLIWHRFWLCRTAFTGKCVRAGAKGEAWIAWHAAAEFAESGPRASSSELAVLNLAIALGEDRFGISGFGRVHRRKAAEAFAHACGWRLEGDIPEQGHSHPDFIPGTPETCARCAIDAGDEGHL
jgi:hypothetical protein